MLTRKYTRRILCTNRDEFLGRPTEDAHFHAFGEALVALGQARADVVVLDGEVGDSTRTAGFAKEFPVIADLQEYIWSHCWQPVELWPVANRAVLEVRNRIDANGRVWLCERPDQIVVIVCGGLGNLQAICLPSWADSEMASAAAVYASEKRPPAIV